MSGFALFLTFAFLLPDLLWWRHADRRLRGRPFARGVLAAFMAPMTAHIVWMILGRRTALDAHRWLPEEWMAAFFLWHILVLPVALLVALCARFVPRRVPLEERRSFLGLLFPIAAASGAIASIGSLDAFRTRRFTLRLPGLPEALRGTRIAHVSDLHYGKFTHDLASTVEAVNGLGADLIAFTGDLIDLSLADLDPALDFLRRLEAPHGLWLCEGNHDLIDDAGAFRQRVRDAGFRLLLDEGAAIPLRGAALQLLGARWGGDAEERRRSMERLRGLRDPAAFPVVLAHHPHAFDEAQGFPLMLSGHTHGGLLMLNERLGAGPLLYRYWSGLYEREGRSLVVSNGIGNWFPIRVHAPAEIALLTLDRA